MKTNKLFKVLAVLSTSTMLSAFSLSSFAQITAEGDNTAVYRAPADGFIIPVSLNKFNDPYKKQDREWAINYVNAEAFDLIPKEDQILILAGYNLSDKYSAAQIEEADLFFPFKRLTDEENQKAIGREIANKDEPEIVEGYFIADKQPRMSQEDFDKLSREKQDQILAIDENKDHRERVELERVKQEELIKEAKKKMAEQALEDEKNGVKESEKKLVISGVNGDKLNVEEKEIVKEEVKEEEKEIVKEEDKVEENDIEKEVVEVKEDAKNLKEMAENADLNNENKNAIEDGIEEKEKEVKELNAKVDNEEDSEKVKELEDKLAEAEKLLEEAKDALKESKKENKAIKTKYTSLEEAYCDQKDKIEEISTQFEDLSKNVQGSLQQLFMAQSFSNPFYNPLMNPNIFDPGFTRFSASNSFGLDYGEAMYRLNNAFRADSLGGVTNNYYNVGGNFYGGDFSSPTHTSTINPMTGMPYGQFGPQMFNDMYSRQFNTPYAYDFNGVTDGYRFSPNIMPEGNQFMPTNTNYMYDSFNRGPAFAPGYNTYMNYGSPGVSF